MYGVHPKTKWGECNYTNIKVSIIIFSDLFL